MKSVTTMVFLTTTLYTTLRYNVVKGVPWADWSTYVLNKSFGLAALVLLTIGVFRRRLTPGSNQHVLHVAGLFAAIHVVLSLMLLSPAYYGKLFVQGKLTGLAGAGLALGAIAAATLALGGRNGQESHPRRTSWKLGALAFVIGGHAALQGFATWFTPLEWPGMMPPVTLISFLFGSAALLAGLWPTSAVNDSQARQSAAAGTTGSVIPTVDINQDK